MSISTPVLRRLVYFVCLMIGLGMSFGQGTAATSAPLLIYELRPTAAASLRWHGPDGLRVALGANSAPATLSYDPTSRELWLTSTGVLEVKGLTAPGAAVLRAETIRLHDSPTTPIQLDVTGSLTLHAETIDLFALQHPASWLRSGGDMILRSPQPILGDAHYSTGGDFRLEDENGRPADLLSPHDPIVLASGNVSFGAYTGASLHVVAGGSINATGNITINGTDTAANTIHPANATTFNGTNTLLQLAVIPLSNGQIVTVRGNIRPTLDLRAGINWTTFAGGAPSNTVIGGGIGPSYAAATTANITTQAITISALNGLVVLSNQYRPNAALTGNITTGAINTNGTTSGFWAGDVNIDSKGNLTTGGINTTVNAPNFADDGGDVRLLAVGNVTTTGIGTGSQVSTVDSVASNGGNVLVRAGGNIQTGGIDTGGGGATGSIIGNTGNISLTSTGGNITFALLDAGIGSGAAVTTGKVGDITVLAPNGSVTTTATNISSRNECSAGATCNVGQGGDIFVSASTGINLPANFTILTTVNSAGRVSGRSGDVTFLTEQGNLIIGTGTLWVRNQATLGSAYRAGHVTFATGQGAVRLNANIEGFARTPDGDVLENNGGVVITATTGITLTNLQSYTWNEGANTPYTTQNGGKVSLYTSNGPIQITGAINTSSDGDAGSGNGGAITLTAPNGPITVGGLMLTAASAANANGQAGNGANVTLTAGGNIQTTNIDTGGSVGAGGTLGTTGNIALTSTGGNVTVAVLDTGLLTGGPYTSDKKGDITILTPNGSVTVNATQMFTRNECTGSIGCDMGQGGDIYISADTGINLNPNLTIATTVDSAGQVHGRSGHLTLLTNQGDIAHAGAIWTRNEATVGPALSAGNITYATGQGAVRLNTINGYARTPDGDVLENNGHVVITATTGITFTGSIFTYVQNEASNTPYTTQNAGDVRLHTSNGPILVAGTINTSSEGDAASGNGGRITLTAPNGSITTNGTLFTGAGAANANGQGGNGADVTLTAGGNIQTTNIDTGGSVGVGGTIGRSGDIQLTSTGGNITFPLLDTGYNFASPYTTGKTGDIAALAPNGSVNITFNNLRTANDCFGNAACHTNQAGDIYISASTGINLPASFTASASSNSAGQSSGRGGNVTFLTEQGNISHTGNLWTLNSAAVGDALQGGHVTYATGQGSVTLNFAETYARTTNGDAGSGGNVTITATTGIAINSHIWAFTQNNGSNTPSTTQNGGDISLHTSSGSITVGNNSLNASNDGDAASGSGGRVTLTAPNGAITLNSNILTNANAANANGQAGDGGHVTLTAGGNIQMTTVDTAGSIGAGGTIGRSGDIQLTSTGGNLTFATLDTAYAGTAPYTTAKSGDITVLAPTGSVNVNSTVMRTANDCFGNVACHTGQAGDILVSASTGINLPANFTISTSSNSAGQSSGRGGNVTFLTEQGNISHTGSLWTLNTAAVGDALQGGHVTYATGQGSVTLNFAETYARTPDGDAGSGGNVTITATTGIAINLHIWSFAQNQASNTPSTTQNGGDISLYTSNGSISVGNNGLNAISDGDAGSGNGGRVTLTAPNGSIQLNNNILTNATATNAGGQAGLGGNVSLTAGGNIQTTNIDTGGGVGAGGSIGRSGDISLHSANGNIAFINLQTDLASQATHAGTGNISVTAPNGQLTSTGTTVRTMIASGGGASNTADAGSITLEADTGITFPANLQIQSMINVDTTSTGRGGDVRLVTNQGNISFAYIWANTSASQGGNMPGSGAVHIETGNGSVQLTDAWGVTNYLLTSNNGQATAATGSVHITATTGITIAGQVQNYANLGVGGTGTVGTGDVSLYTSNGPIRVNSNIITSSNGRTTTGPTGDITLQAPNGSITIGGTTTPDANAGDVGGQAAESGNITLLARDNIQTGNLDTGGNSIGTGGSVGRTGSVFAESQLGNITVGLLSTDITAVATYAGTGDIHLRALNGQINVNHTTIASRAWNTDPLVSNTADAGDIILEAGTGINFLPNTVIQSMVNVGGTSTGRGGNVRLTTNQGNISFAFIWANTTTGQGGNIPGSGAVHIETGNGSVQLTDGTWGVTNYLLTSNNGQATAATGSVHITATTGITIAGNVQNFVNLGVGGTSTVGTGDVSLYTNNGPVRVNASINNQILGRTISGPSGGITLTAPNGSITVNGTTSTFTQASEANGQAGTAGPITLMANSHIATGGLNSAGNVGANGTHAGGGNITLASGNGNVTFNNSLTTGFNTGNAITTGPAGNVSITAPNGQIASSISTLTTLNASASTASTIGRGGDVTMQAGTGFNWPANFAIRTESFSNGQVNGRGGNVSLQTNQGNIVMGSIWTHSHAQSGNSQAGGNITLSTNDGTIQLPSGLSFATYSRAITGNATASAGNITLNATQGISINDIWGFTFANGTAMYGADVQLNTSNGNITAGLIDTSLTAGSTGWQAGDILLNAPNGTITANNLLNANANTAANTPVQAGNIALTSSGNIQTQSVVANAPNGPAQQGGTIELTSGQMVRALGSINANGIGSAITITHGGNGVIPFIVGNAATNGSTGALTTAATQILPTNSYLYTHHQTPNIWIISVPGPNLALGKQVTPSLIDQGGTVTYTVVLTNSGPTAANGLVLTDLLPPQVVFGSWLAQPAGAVQAGQNITWTGNLAASTAVTLQFTAVHIGNYGDVVTNTANYYLTAQPSLNGTANATFTVAEPPNVSVGKSVSATSPALPSQPVSYTISVANESATAVARNVVITDTIPAQLVGLSVSTSGLTILNTTGSYVWELADLAPNQSGTIIVSGFINPALAADVTFTNTVTLTADGDPNPADNSASVALTVQLPRVQLGTAATAVGEPNGPALLNVTLDRAQPYRPVTVTATTSDGTAVAGSDYTAITQTVVFAPNQTTAVVAMPIIDDTVQEASEAFYLTLSAPDGAILTAPTTATITIVDNDNTTGVLITPVLLAVAEGGATDSYEVRLGSAPTDTVTITIAPDGQLTTSSAVLTFTAATWSVPQVVTVTAVDDAISEGNHLGFVQHTVASNDPAYNALPAATVIAAIADNETAGIVLTPLTGNMAEGGATASYTITLQAQPTAPVTITITPDGQVTTSATELVFTAANWATPQVVTVTAVDDAIAEGNHVGFVAHSVASGDPNYNAAPLGAFIANIADNDGAVVSVAPTSLAVAEGGVSASYAISLTSEPTADVSVNISPDSQLTTDVAVLTFTAANWDTPQMVQVTAVDDAIAEGNHVGLVAHTATSGDPAYHNQPVATVLANITDNDNAAVSVSPTSLAVAEGGVSVSYAISLTSEPTAAVYVNISPDSQLTTDVAVLTFTAANWDVAQTVQVTAVDDAIAEGNHVGLVAHTATSGDPAYHNQPVATVLANIADNDHAAVSIAPTSLAVAEGGVSVSYAISLTSEPTADVSVNINPDSQLTTDVAVLTFTAANWDTPQMVQVTAVDDALVEGDHSAPISHSTSSGDATYNGLFVASVAATIADNDLSYRITADLSLVLEGDLGDSTPITFTVQRSGGVTGTASTVDFALSGTATAGVDYGSVLPAGGQLSFAVGETSQQITLLVLGDGIDEVDESIIATLSNPTAPGTAVLATATATTVIVDDDGTPSLNLNAPATVGEGAGSVTFTVTLSHASAQVVTVDVATSDGTATAGADYAPLTQTVSFPAGQTAVTLTVAIVDDADVEGDETFVVTLSNPQNGVLGGAAQATITIVDNDVPPAIPTIYLPLVLKAPDPNVRPDLVVSSVVVSSNDLEIVITNVGGAAVTTSFWVDAFINPTTPPTAVNQTVAQLGGTNIAWGIATTLAPGQSITLRRGDANQAPQYTTHSGPIAAGVPVYVHVDAFSEGSSVGAVLEQHELDGTPYNNISGPFSH